MSGVQHTIWDRRRFPEEWAVYPWGDTIRESFGYVEGGAPVDLRVRLDETDPRVGQLARWGGGSYTAVVRAVVYVDEQPESLLLEDFTGFPWVRVGLDAELLPRRNQS